MIQDARHKKPAYWPLHIAIDEYRLSVPRFAQSVKSDRQLYSKYALLYNIYYCVLFIWILNWNTDWFNYYNFYNYFWIYSQFLFCTNKNCSFFFPLYSIADLCTVHHLMKDAPAKLYGFVDLRNFWWGRKSLNKSNIKF